MKIWESVYTWASLSTHMVQIFDKDDKVVGYFDHIKIIIGCHKQWYHWRKWQSSKSLYFYFVVMFNVNEFFSDTLYATFFSENKTFDQRFDSILKLQISCCFLFFWFLAWKMLKIKISTSVSERTATKCWLKYTTHWITKILKILKFIRLLT